MSSAEKTPVSLTDLPPCPVETTLTLISDKWKVLVQNLYSMRCQSGEKIIKT